MMTQSQHITLADVRQLLDEVHDPEIPVITIGELGILRNVHEADGKFVITITPTYSGCPAMDMISMEIAAKMRSSGVSNFKIVTQLSPAWTTDWMTPAGKRKLKEFGIAPPIGRAGQEDLSERHPPCPQCGSVNTELVSEFGSTACKALFRCMDCREPFDYFKCH